MLVLEGIRDIVSVSHLQQKYLKSDNGQTFQGHDFKQFSEEQGSDHFTVVSKDNTMILAEGNGRKNTRNSSFFKILPNDVYQ